jgi:hypothetical protein
MNLYSHKIHAGYERNRAAARGVQAKDQDADRAAIGGHRAALSAACLRQINMRKVDGCQPIDLAA